MDLIADFILFVFGSHADDKIESRFFGIKKWVARLLLFIILFGLMGIYYFLTS